MNKQERIKRFKSLSSNERQELIIKKMKVIGIEVGSGISNKKYDSKEIHQLIHIMNHFPELRDKDKLHYLFLLFLQPKKLIITIIIQLLQFSE